MLPGHLEEFSDPKIPYMVIGRVVDTNDPKGVGRVRVIVDGLIEEPSAWARPAMGFAGPAFNDAGQLQRRGTFWPPERGTDVYVMFELGDVDHPVYFGGYFGAEAPDEEGQGAEPDVPTSVKDIPPEERAKMRAIETEHFLILIDDRSADPADPESESASGKQRLVIVNKADPEIFIELDGLNKVATLSATGGVVIRSSGTVSLEGLQVQIQGRVVSPVSTKEI